MEIPYLLNNSPDLHGTSGPGEHWATYELNGEPIDHEPGPLGKVRVHDDYWNLDYKDNELYNFDVRNDLNISDEKLDKLLGLIEDKNIAVLLHAHNLEDIWAWSRSKPVIMINCTIGEWKDNIENWAMREYNYLMEDERNANFSDAEHAWPGCDAVADHFVARMHLDSEWKEKQSDRSITQVDWMQKPDIYSLWDKVGIQAPSKEWIDAYLEDYATHQEYNNDLLVDLRLAYDNHQNRYN